MARRARRAWIGVALVALACAPSCTSGGFLTSLDGGPTPDASTSGGGKRPDASARSKDATSKDSTAAHCGEASGDLCSVGSSCSKSGDCKSGLCKSGLCAAPPPSCTDGTKDGKETGVDCGGPECPACGAGQGCSKTSDCKSLVCTAGTCQAATDADGVMNGGETDVDCGGALLANGQMNPSSDGAPVCQTGQTCLLPSDCSQGVCNGARVMLADAGTLDASAPDSGASDAAVEAMNASDGGAGRLYCQPASSSDSVQNDSETDVDCGGATLADGTSNLASDGAPACTAGQKCLLGADCQQRVCNANGNMGGGPIDCPSASDACTCQVPWDNDGVKNDSETDVDCGGSSALGSDGAPGCAPLQHCLVNTDCASFLCGTNGLCTPPTDTDGVKNGGETDVDCGGALLSSGGANPASDGANRCADAKACALDTDCLSGFCSALSNRCVDGQSCKGLVPAAQIMDPTGMVDADGDALGSPDPNGVGQNAGIDTCGVGEATDPVASQSHESCCRSLLLPDSSVRLDKYEITAGRMRQFAASLNYDIVDWANAQIAAGTPAGKTLAAQIPASEIALLPHSADPNEAMNAVQQLGGTTIDPQSQEQGCYVGAGAYGASVYFWDANTLDGVGSPPRPFTQDYYDIKSQNCALYQMYAAFCAWDGGQLATVTQELAAYGTSTYPWGAASRPSPYPYKNYANQQNPWCGGTVNAGLPNVSMINQLSATTGQPSTALTINWLNSNNTGNAGCFYYYPSYPASNPNSAVADSLSTGLDLSPQIAAPGRFFLDVTAAKSPSFGTGEGWYDLGANQLEIDQVATLTGPVTLCDCTGVSGPNDGALSACTCCAPPTCTFTKTGVLRASNLPYAYLEGGSWEGHTSFEPSSTAFWTAGGNDGLGWPTSGQYGKIGARCSRPVEPAN